ncbi:hypothetical protein PsYK624_025860 [Phanerochaete sordida]|uniref:Uncharacterized protein n=1 Tax=Phanerochaete sordida TaxID=48140 RepID=A0A9P3G1H6_9APHY|nr:hypothetical protein PsYK624_025860 [Phanerochaete sordida]
MDDFSKPPYLTSLPSFLGSPGHKDDIACQEGISQMLAAYFLRHSEESTRRTVKAPCVQLRNALVVDHTRV